MLEIRHFSKDFNGLPVLSNFSLALPRNSFTVLVGPSGCGKSTLFDLLMGSVSRDGGRLFLFGAELPDLRGEAGYMAQKDLLLPWLSLIQNALLPVMVKRKLTSDDFTEAKSLFSSLELSGFENHYPRQVSGGMSQRCALARTLFFRAPLALLDEPLSAVDALTRQSLRTMLLLLQSRFEKTILMVTHDVDDALFLADRIVVLSRSPMMVTQEFIPEGKKPRNPSNTELLHLKEHILRSLQEGR